MNLSIFFIKQRRLFCLLLSILPVKYIYADQNTAQSNNDQDYVFDQAFFRGTSANKKALLRLSQGENISLGTYKVDLYINGQLIENIAIPFLDREKQGVEPCFSPEQLQRASVLVKISDKNIAPQCGFLDELVGAGISNFDLSRLRLDLSIPNSFMKQVPRGYVAPEDWKVGTSIGFINYIANYYHNAYTAAGQTFQQDSTFVSLNGGVNLGKWQYRQLSNLTFNDSGNKWNNIRSYIKRPIASIKSEISLGQLSSTGRFFSGLSFNGLNISSDDRMLPDSMRGYAPIIQGIAKTTARVSVQQNGREIYQTTVAAGPFKISDLFPTNYNGDLNVIIYEADGTISEFKVPFSAVPESVRQGYFKYNFDFGRTRNIGEDTDFANITTQYGLNNAITLNQGFRIADGYQSAMLGSTFTNYWGAFGADMTYSRAKLAQNNLDHESYIDGWMFGASYSKTIQPTNTTIALAGYRFSTEGYRDLADVIALRKSIKDGTPFQSSTYKERSRVTLSLNQSLAEYGSLFISGSAQSYRDDRADDYQLQLGYGKAFRNGVSLNVSVARQKRGLTYSANASENIGGMFGSQNNNDTETSYGISLTMPLGKIRDNQQNLMLNYTGDQHHNAYQTALSGSLDQKSSLNYNIGYSYDDQSKQSVYNGGLQKHFSLANVGLNASVSDHYWQASANMQGALAIHSGGLTLGPYLSDTFALVEAKGAKGAKINNALGSVINSSGYALLPALTPYRYNTISLNPEGMENQIELESGDIRIAPYSGAAIKVNFKTRSGFAVLIKSSMADGSTIPLGSDVLDDKGQYIGMVGQNGQVYLRTESPQGKLIVKWGDTISEQCSIDYTIKKEQIDQQLINLSEICK